MGSRLHSQIASSKRRFRDYFERRRAAGSEQRVADRTEQRDQHVAARRKRSMEKLFLRFFALLRGRHALVAACLATLTLATLLGLAVPYSSKIAIDYILTDNPGPAGWPAIVPLDPAAEHARLAALVALALTILAFALGSAALGVWGRYQCTRLVKKLQATLRRRAFEHAVRLPLGRVGDLKSGGVASILREDAGNAAELLFSMIYNPWRAVVQLLGTLAILAVVDWRMLAGSLLFIPTVWLSHRTWIERIRPVYRDIRRTRETIDAQATESFGGIRVVRGFHREAAEGSRFTRDNHFMARQEILAWWWSRLLEIAWQVLIPTASAAVLIYGGWQVLEGSLTVGDLMAFSAYVLYLLGPLEALVSTATQVQSNLAGFDRTLDLLGEPTEFQHTRAIEHPVTRETTAGRVTLDNVSFAYPRSARRRLEDADDGTAPQPDATPRPPVLRNVSLEAHAGETIALVGPSGSGKTTLTNLVARFYDPTGGVIRLDGRDLRTLDLDGYRRLLGIVEQDVFLFDGTVAQNIAYGRREAREGEIVAAAEAANAHGFIAELDDGYDTLIGERGVRLSGGQKQRLAIARAILADPAILILDEATSNLDSESERLIQSSLADLMRGRTSFVIAHRLSTIRHADRIAVLERGELIELGTHDDLLARGGRYADLLRLQTGDETGVPS